MCARHAQSACHQSTGTGMCILGQFSEFRIQNMHSILYVYFQSIFRNMLPHILMHGILMNGSALRPIAENAESRRGTWRAQNGVLQDGMA